MPAWKAISRRELIRTLRKFGFQGPYSGGRHEFMVRGDLCLTIPNPHGKDIGIKLLSIILREAAISRRDWERT